MYFEDYSLSQGLKERYNYFTPISNDAAGVLACSYVLDYFSQEEYERFNTFIKTFHKKEAYPFLSPADMLKSYTAYLLYWLNEDASLFSDEDIAKDANGYAYIALEFIIRCGISICAGDANAWYTSQRLFALEAADIRNDVNAIFYMRPLNKAGNRMLPIWPWFQRKEIASMTTYIEFDDGHFEPII